VSTDKWRLMPLVAFLAIVPYQIAQRLAASPTYHLEESAVDRLVAFNPAWVWVYLSLYLLVTMALSLAPSAETVRRYLWGLLGMIAVSCVAWLVWPIAGPRPVEPVDAGAMFMWLASIDRPINTVPSMHIELAVYSLLFTQRTWTRGGTRMLVGGGWLWVALIAWACLATKQHFAIDLAAGFAVAVAGDAWAWRGRPLDERPTLG
jgi:hypothetical protein